MEKSNLVSQLMVTQKEYQGLYAVSVRKRQEVVDRAFNVCAKVGDWNRLHPYDKILPVFHTPVAQLNRATGF